MPLTIYLPRTNEPFRLIPYGMRPGQHPEDIPPTLRADWVSLACNHPGVPRDVMWGPGTFDVVDADPGPALALNLALRNEQLLADLNGDLEEAIRVAKAIHGFANSLRQARHVPPPDLGLSLRDWPRPGQSDLFDLS